MSTLLYWFGVIHVAAYTVAGFLFASGKFIDWAVRRFKLKADIMRAMVAVWEKRRSERLEKGKFVG